MEVLDPAPEVTMETVAIDDYAKARRNVIVDAVLCFGVLWWTIFHFAPENTWWALLAMVGVICGLCLYFNRAVAKFLNAHWSKKTFLANETQNR